MHTSAKLAIRQPDAGDPADVPSDIDRLLSDIETCFSTQGTFAARPAFGHPGRRYFATDTSKEYLDIGTGWADITGTTSGGGSTPSDVQKQGTLAARPATASAGVSYFATDVGVEYLSDGSNWTPISTVPFYDHLTGNDASKPAATTGLAGTLYIAADTGWIYRSDATNWTLVGAAPKGVTQYGTFSARPVATAVPAGTLYFASDNGYLYRSSGSSWTTIASAPGSLMVNAQTGTAYTLQATDAGKLVTFNNAAAITVTIPTYASGGIAVPAQIEVAQEGAGQVTFVGAAGVTFPGGYQGKTKLAGQYAGGSLVQIAQDVWRLYGTIA